MPTASRVTARRHPRSRQAVWGGAETKEHAIKPDTKEFGALQALIHRFRAQRLRCLLKIKRLLKLANTLSASGIDFPHLMLNNANQARPLSDYQPDFQDISRGWSICCMKLRPALGKESRQVCLSVWGG